MERPVKQCKSLTKKSGQRCSKPSQPYTDYCSWHSDNPVDVNTIFSFFDFRTGLTTEGRATDPDAIRMNNMNTALKFAIFRDDLYTVKKLLDRGATNVIDMLRAAFNANNVTIQFVRDYMAGNPLDQYADLIEQSKRERTRGNHQPLAGELIYEGARGGHFVIRNDMRAYVDWEDDI